VGPIPQLELERMALEWAPAHGAPADVALEAARVAWLKASQGNCGNVLLYLDGVLRRQARQAQQRAERAAAAAAAPPLCPHRNDPGTCGQCNYQAPAGPMSEQARAEVEAWKRAHGLLPGRAPPAQAS
jgi:hypothetical protein